MAFLFLSIINYIYNRLYISWRVSDLNAAHACGRTLPVLIWWVGLSNFAQCHAGGKIKRERCGLIAMQLPEKYKENFDVSSEGPLTKLVAGKLHELFYTSAYKGGHVTKNKPIRWI